MIMRKRPKADDNGFAQWGGYMDAKIAKLQEQYDDDTTKNNPFKKSDLFKGVSIFVNGYTKPSADELKRMMMTHGGTYHHYQRSNTSFVIASNLPDVKVRQITSDKIIKPDWIVDCIKENRIVDYSKYLLYTNHKVSQPKIQFGRTNPKSMPEVMAKGDVDNKTSVDYLEMAKGLELLNEKFQAKSKQQQHNTVLSDDEFEPLIMPESPPLSEQQPPESEQNSQELGTSEESSPNKTEEDSLMYHNETIQIPNESSKSFAATSANEADKSSNQCCKTAVDPNFLSEFYNKSRLHHISALGAGFKQHINELREKSDFTFPARDHLKGKFDEIVVEIGNRVVMHIDMDCFFVSVGLRARPELHGQPIAVTHSKGNGIIPREGYNRQAEIELNQKRMQDRFGQDLFQSKYFDGIDETSSMAEIASCSYEARKMGVKNGMFVGTAMKLCPKLKTIPYDFAGYKEVAFMLYDTIAKYTLDIEAVSCDEMFVDLTAVLNDIKISVVNFVTHLRNEIKEKTGCPCSAGIGQNRLQARLATKKAKPDGQFILEKSQIPGFMKEILIADLPGVGFSTTNRLMHFGWKYCGDLKHISLILLQKEFGKKFGETLYQFSRGIDNRPLVFSQVRKSVSADVNYGIRFKEYSELETFLKQLCEEVHRRLMDVKRKGKMITLKLLVRAKDAPVETSKFMGHGVCDYINKSMALTDFTCDLNVITKSVLSIMKAQSVPPHELRGIGIQITKLNPVQTFDGIKKQSAIIQMFDKQKEANKIELPLPQEEPLTQKVEEKKAIPKTPTKKSAAKPMPPSKSPSRAAKSPVSKTTTANSSGTRSGRTKKPQALIKPSNFKTLPHIFINSAQKKASPMPSTSTSLPKLGYDKIDMDVLAELPEDIQNEILNDQQSIVIEDSPKLTPVESIEVVDQKEEDKLTVTKQFLDALPLKLRCELEKEIAAKPEKFIVKSEAKSVDPPQPSHIAGEELEPTPPRRFQPSVSEIRIFKPKSPNSKKLSGATTQKRQSLTQNILLKSEWRDILKSWIKSSDNPLHDDINMIMKNSRDLIVTREWDELYLKLRYIHRLINDSRECRWHRAYYKIVNYIQNEMLSVSSSKLHVNYEFNCKLNECKEELNESI